MKTYDAPKVDQLTAIIAQNTNFKNLYTLKMMDDMDSNDAHPIVAQDLCPHHYEKTLQDLMDDQLLNAQLIHQLISDYYQMTIEADQYLLNPDYVLMTLDNIYYQTTDKHFKFVYLPLKMIHMPDFNSILQSLLIRLYLDKGLNHKLLYKALNALKDKQYKEVQKIMTACHKKQFSLLHKSSKKTQLAEEQLVNPSAYILNKARPEEKYTLCYKQNTIGRGKENTICLENENIALTQAIIYKTDPFYRIRKVSSEGHLQVNQEDIINESHLKSGDSLYIGNKEFIFIA